MAVVAVPLVVLGVLRVVLQFPQGDEPHYLVISQALQLYGSLDVAQVYAHGDYHAYYPLPLDPHLSPGPDGRPLPLHSIGGPLLWFLPFALWGRAGVVGFMTVVSLAIVANVYWLARELDVRQRVAVGVAVAFGLGTPILMYASLSFVEPLGALVCVYALRVLQARTTRPARPPARLGGVGGAALDPQPVPAVPGGARRVPGVARAALARARWPACSARRRCSSAAWSLYNALVWHTFGLAPNQVNAGAVPFTADPWRPLLGILLDQEVGVFPNFPVLLFVLPGLLLAWRTPLTWHVAAVVVPYVAVITSFPAWDGAWSPPARFLAVVLPMFAGHVALVWDRAGPRTLAVGGLLTAVGLGLTTLAVCSPTGGFTAQKGRSPALGVLDGLSGFDVARLVPVARAARPGGAVRDLGCARARVRPAQRAGTTRSSHASRSASTSSRLVSLKISCRASGPHRERHVGEPGRPQPLDERVDQRELTVHRVGVAHHDVDRQVLADAREPVGVGHVAGPGEHRLAAFDVQPEAAARVGDVRVDLRVVAGEPLVAGAVRERRVERREVDRAVEVERGLQQVDRRRARQRQRPRSARSGRAGTAGPRTSPCCARTARPARPPSGCGCAPRARRCRRPGCSSRRRRARRARPAEPAVAPWPRWSWPCTRKPAAASVVARWS